MKQKKFFFFEKKQNHERGKRERERAKKTNNHFETIMFLLGEGKRTNTNEQGEKKIVCGGCGNFRTLHSLPRKKKKHHSQTKQKKAGMKKKDKKKNPSENVYVDSTNH